jgi:hypothetical protein
MNLFTHNLTAALFDNGEFEDRETMIKFLHSPKACRLLYLSNHIYATLHLNEFRGKPAISEFD